MVVVLVFTFSQDLWNLGVAGTEGAVDLEAVGVVKKGAAQGEQHFLFRQTHKSSRHIFKVTFHFEMLCGNKF